jgi:hypothetical protein
VRDGAIHCGAKQLHEARGTSLFQTHTQATRSAKSPATQPHSHTLTTLDI